LDTLSKPAYAVVLGLCSHGLAVARALASADVPVLAIEKDLRLPGVRSRAVQRVHWVSSFEANALVAGLLDLRRQLPDQAKVVLFPINDNQVRIIAQHLGELGPHFHVSWAPCAELVLKLLNKDALTSFCRDRGLKYPRSVVLTSPTVDANGIRRLRFPLIIKPVRPLSSFKALIARDQAHLADLLARHQADLPILAQDHIAGDDRRLYFVALLLHDGAVLHAEVGRKLASFPPAMGQTTVAETVRDEDAKALAHRFFAGTGLSGPVSLELKRDAQGQFWVIEPTVGRTDFWAALFIRSSFNRPLMAFELASGSAVSKVGARCDSVWYDTERAPLAYLAQVWATRSLRPHGKQPVFPYLDRSDWRPFVRACQVQLGKQWTRFLRRCAAALPGRLQSRRAMRP